MANYQADQNKMVLQLKRVVRVPGSEQTLTHPLGAGPVGEVDAL